MRTLKLALLISVGLFDGACVGTSLLPHAHSGELVILLTLHLFAALGGALATYAAGPVHACVGSQRTRLALVAGLLCLFMPVVGPAGLAAVLAWGLGAGPRRAGPAWITFTWEPELARARAAPRARESASAAAIASTLRDLTPAKADKRFQALLAARRVRPRTAVDLYKLALKDPSDEVRLFAFSRLERMRGDLERSVRELGDALRAAGEEQRARVALRLAQAHWDIVYLGLAEGAVREHTLGDARAAAMEACRGPRVNGPAEFLLGRVLMALGEHDEAYGALRRALGAGYAMKRALPYLAECAFVLRRWGEVRGAMQELVRHGVPPLLTHVEEFWR
jgi:tetratricopeptide (TPR) repeat protein